MNTGEEGSYNPMNEIIFILSPPSLVKSYTAQ